MVTPPLSFHLLRNRNLRQLRAARGHGDLREHRAVSEHRSSRVLGADRAAIRDQSVRPDDASTPARLRALAGERRRFGYRQLELRLSREGVVLNHKKLRVAR